MRSEEYDPIHPPGTLEENLPKEKCLGEVDPATMKAEAKKEESAEDKQIARNKDELPPLDLCLNLYDFEVSPSAQRARAAAHDAHLHCRSLLGKCSRARHGPTTPPAQTTR